MITLICNASLAVPHLAFQVGNAAVPDVVAMTNAEAAATAVIAVTAVAAVAILTVVMGMNTVKSKGFGIAAAIRKFGVSTTWNTVSRRWRRKHGHQEAIATKPYSCESSRFMGG